MHASSTTLSTSGSGRIVDPIVPSHLAAGTILQVWSVISRIGCVFRRACACAHRRATNVDHECAEGVSALMIAGRVPRVVRGVMGVAPWSAWKGWRRRLFSRVRSRWVQTLELVCKQMARATMEIAAFDTGTTAPPPEAPWLRVHSIEACGPVVQWITDFGPTTANVQNLHFGGMGDLLHASLYGSGDIDVEVRCNESMEVCSTRITLAQRGQEMLAAPGGRLASEAVLCMAIARLHHLTRRPQSPGGTGTWPRPRRRRGALMDHQRRALAWMREMERSAETLRLSPDGSLSLGSSHRIQYDGRAPGCRVEEVNGTVAEGSLRADDGFAVAGAGYFDPVGSGKSTTVACLITDRDHCAATTTMLQARARDLGGPELLGAPTETLVVCGPEAVRHWVEEVRGTGAAVVTAENTRELMKLRTRARLAPDTPRVAVVSSAVLSSPSYASWVASTLARLAGFIDRGSLGDVHGDPSLVRTAAARATVENPLQDVPIELFAWPRVVVDDAHASKVRLGAGFSWSVTGSPGPVDGYLDRFLPRGFPEWQWSHLAHAASRRLCWRWAPTPPDGPLDTASYVAHRPTPDEAASARDDGVPESVVALRGVRSVVRRTVTAPAALAEAREYANRVAGSLERSAASYELQAHDENEPDAAEALRASAASMRQRASVTRREYDHFCTVVGSGSAPAEAQGGTQGVEAGELADTAGCPVCMGTPDAHILPLCGHAVCEDCMRRITGSSGSHRCAICRVPLRADAMWRIGDPTTVAAGVGSATEAILNIVRESEVAIVWCSTTAEATAAVASMREFVPTESLRGSAASRRATCKRLWEKKTRVLVVAASRVDGRLSLPPISDVVVYGHLGTPAHTARAIAPLMPLTPGVGAKLHMVGEGAAQCISEWRNGALAEAQRASSLAS